ncbi:MAG: hypothetical protein CFE21_08860 [Bacteroidetes bacterium B1(2017)]|nr:MAG: hypothetical protein CFE21_08860 [Bacteroidetes bacterium B1(2017)]
MKKLLLLLSVICCLYSCKQDTKTPFSQFNFTQILPNGLKYPITDTVFTVSKNDLYKCYDSDTMGYLLYDSASNVIEIERYEIMGTTIKYKYNNLGLPIAKLYITDCVGENQFLYRFDPISRTLYQIWMDGSRIDTCFYYFNTEGNLLKSLSVPGHSIYPFSHLYLAKYYYTNSGLLSIKTETKVKGKITEGDCHPYNRFFNKRTTLFYYTNSILDSSLAVYFCPFEPRLNYFTKTYFNKGRPLKEVTCNTFITNYLYKKE